MPLQHNYSGGVCNSTWKPFVILATLAYRSLILFKYGSWTQHNTPNMARPSQSRGVFTFNVPNRNITVIHRLHLSCQEALQTVA